MRDHSGGGETLLRLMGWVDVGLEGGRVRALIQVLLPSRF